jgi:hypothetical protein
MTTELTEETYTDRSGRVWRWTLKVVIRPFDQRIMQISREGATIDGVKASEHELRMLEDDTRLDDDVRRRLTVARGEAR